MIGSGETAFARRRRGSRSSQAKGSGRDDAPKSAGSRTPKGQLPAREETLRFETEAQNRGSVPPSICTNHSVHLARVNEKEEEPIL